MANRAPQLGPRRSSGPRPNLREAGAPYRWKPGQSGNAGNRKSPQAKLITEALKEGLGREAILDGKRSGQTVASVIGTQILTRAMDLNNGLADATFVADRVEGRPKQAVEMSGPDSEAIRVSVNASDVVKKLLGGD
jgi:hypothetical protein